nr:MAG TPA: hypothetical protein [Caudoviricetes sp.]
MFDKSGFCPFLSAESPLTVSFVPFVLSCPKVS